MLSKKEEEAIIFDIRFGDLSLYDLVKEQRTQRICNELFIKLNGSNKSIGFLFTNIPKEFITQEMCDVSFEEDSYFIKYFPKEFITKEMCDRAFKKYSWLIKYFPKKFITEGMKKRTN